MGTITLDTASYLSRLGIEGNIVPDENTLLRLTRAHLEQIPFENLEIWAEHREPSLEPQDLFAKVVTGKRGGYCFELNKLFYLLLTALGYSCRSIPARVVHHRQDPRPISHRATIVTVEGHHWLCDVGFGGAGPKGAIRIDTEEPQTVYGDTFFVQPEQPDYPGEYGVFRVDDGVPSRVLVLLDRPWLDADFLTLSSYYATYHNSPFKRRRILYRCTPNGWVNLTDNTLTIVSNGIRQIVELQTADQIRQTIQQLFGLDVPGSEEPIPFH